MWKAGLLNFLHGDAQITKDVRCVVAPGHTRGLQVVVVETGDRPLLYVNDLASFAVHFERRAWVTAYDVEPLETIRTKATWQAWALEHKATLIFEHDTTLAVGELVEVEEGKYKVQAVVL